MACAFILLGASNRLALLKGDELFDREGSWGAFWGRLGRGERGDEEEKSNREKIEETHIGDFLLYGPMWEVERVGENQVGGGVGRSAAVYIIFEADVGKNNYVKRVEFQVVGSLEASFHELSAGLLISRLYEVLHSAQRLFGVYPRAVCLKNSVVTANGTS